MSQRQAASAKATKRRTQAERSAATKERLLAATVDCLYELGYHRTTTYSVEQRAGVTRGALLHHFSSKPALLIAAAEYLVDTAERQLTADAATLPAENLGEELSGLLWRQFTSRIFFAFMEISMAARTDQVLRDALAEPQKLLDAQCRNVAAQLLGTSVDNTDFVIGLELSIRFMRGAASTVMFGERPEIDDKVHHEWQRLVTPYFVSCASKTRKCAPRD